MKRLNDAGSDFQISLQQIKFLAPRVNKGIRFILVVDGELKIETNSRFYDLKENDLLVINRNQLYRVQGSDKNSVLILTISDAFMDHHYGEYRNHRFECFSREVDMGREEMILSIRKLLANVMISYYRQEESYKIEINGYISQILLILIRRFKENGKCLSENRYRRPAVIPNH